MPLIRVLADNVANQIAAGEVVERPAAVVKELVENSIDAGATRIEVEFRHGGRSLIRVDDNGSGMSPEDARLCLDRHATSKLALASDLDALTTFGFRGEAIPSIASVSIFQLRTRRDSDPEGTEILVEGGRIRHVRACGRAPGTQIIVGQLFAPVPARRKFLKKDSTEAAHIIQCVRRYALAFPSIGFTLLEDGRTHLRVAPAETLAGRIAEVVGRDTAALLREARCSSDGMHLTAFLSGPGVSRGTRQEITCFVNRRPVESRALTYALVEAYGKSLGEGKFPVAVLYLEIPPARVDVNVHPTKREIRFRDEFAVRRLVCELVWNHFRSLGLEIGAVQVPPPAFPDGYPPIPAMSTGSQLPGETSTARDIESQPPSSIHSIDTSLSPSRPAGTTAPEHGFTPPVARSGYGRGWRWLGNALDGYCVFETASGLVLLDPRAAAERILLERLEKSFATGPVEGQHLLFPIAVEFEPILSAVLVEHRSLLASIGFDITDFGRDFYRIEAVPPWMEPAHAEAFVREFTELAREGRIPIGRPGVAREALAKLAATKAAVTSVPASSDQASRLVSELFQCAQPLVDASGRPTLIEFTPGEIARRFSRR